MDTADRLAHGAEIRLREDQDVPALDAEAAGAQLDLRRGLLARHIQDGAALRERRGCLHEE